MRSNGLERLFVITESKSGSMLASHPIGQCPFNAFPFHISAIAAAFPYETKRALGQ